MGEAPLPPADSPDYQFSFLFGCGKCAIKAQAEAVLRGDEYSVATAKLLQSVLASGQDWSGSVGQNT